MGKRIAALGTVLLVSATSAPAAPPGVTYDCDTAAGHFSELVLPAPTGTFTVTGNVQLMTLAEGSKYASMAKIQVASSSKPGASPDRHAGFSLVALPVDPRKAKDGQKAIQMLNYNVQGKEDEVLPSSLLTKPGTIQPFTLLYDGKNLTVGLGNETKKIELSAVDPVVRIVCSTGEFLFTDLAIAPLR